MPDTEERIAQLHGDGDVEGALKLAVEAYGPEVYGFLVSRLRDEDMASDAFAQACEDLCAGVGAFKWRCSMRTWLYKLARSAAAREGRGPHRRAGRNIPLSQVSEVAEQARSRTREYLRTEVKDGFAALREELPAEDQSLLILRVDRGLDWLEVAEVLGDGEIEEEELKRAAARLRQRFKTVKARLRQRAVEVGLIEADDPAG
jgi:RNA polymerase sigma-70 factor, ECF subfamily